MTPFKYCFNNPINYIDPFGLWEATAGGYTTKDSKDIEQILSYVQSEKAISKKDPGIDQMISFIGTVKDGGQGKLSDGSVLLSSGLMVKSGSNNWTADKQNWSNVWNEVNNTLCDKTYQNANTGLGAFGVGSSTKELMIQGAVAQSRGVI